jgi:hypothetical protein
VNTADKLGFITTCSCGNVHICADLLAWKDFALDYNDTNSEDSRNQNSSWLNDLKDATNISSDKDTYTTIDEDLVKNLFGK